MIPEVAVEVLAVEIRLDLLRVGGGDGGDAVRVGQAALEHVGFPVVELEHRIIEEIIRQVAPVFQVLDAADALEPQVVNREHAAGLADGRIGEGGAQVEGRQGRLPVVTVNHIRNPLQIVQNGQRRLGEIAVFGNILP